MVSRRRFLRAASLGATGLLAGCAALDTSRETDDDLSLHALRPDDVDRDAGFGSAVAVDGDTVLAGAPEARPDGGVRTGAAYVFERGADGWTQRTELAPGSTDARVGFGDSVALHGNVAVVESASRPAVHVYRRQDGAWTHRTVIEPGNGRLDGATALGTAADADTVVTGVELDAEQWDGEPTTAYVLERSNGGWEQTVLRDAVESPRDEFGAAVAVDGSTAIVGAPRADRETRDVTGIARVFERSNAEWTHQTTLRPADPVPGSDRFGESVALDSDTAVVGASLHVEADRTPGAAYVFERAGGEWQQTATLDPRGETYHAFGRTVAVDGETVLVGEPLAEAAAGSSAGRVYEFRPSDDGWTRRRVATRESNEGILYHLGTALSVDDGTVAAGTNLDGTLSDEEVGSVYVFPT